MSRNDRIEWRLIVPDRLLTVNGHAASSVWRRGTCSGSVSFVVSRQQWLVSRLRTRFQHARADLFMRLLMPKPGMRTLDLGGGDGSFSELLTSRVPLDITVADVSDHSAACKMRGFDFVHLDGARGLPFDDASFDLVFCNSVIEHVTLPRHDCVRTDVPEAEWQQNAQLNQSHFASEIRRVSRAYFVQTPHRRFPIEHHTLLPFVNLMSHRTTQRVIRHTNRFWIRAQVADWRLLDRDEMQAFFPDATIEVERFLGVEKSIVAYRARP